MNRVGIGIDVHRFVAGRKLIMGGVEVPSERGLEGHSDADVLAHAIADALLGAVALGDIGKFYPDTDMKLKNMDSMIIIRDVAAKLREIGARINNVDAAAHPEDAGNPRQEPWYCARAGRHQGHDQ